MLRLAAIKRTIWRSLAEIRCRLQALHEWHLRAREESEARGITLLREWLSREQRAQFDAHRYFEVVGSSSGKRYRIHYGTATNVHEIDNDGWPRMGWCFRPIGPLVAGDIMLAQKIALETNERAALAVANRFPVYVPLRTGTFRTR
jgi:hypothetical protein